MDLIKLYRSNKPVFIIGVITLVILILLSISAPKSQPEEKKATLVKHYETNVGIWADIIGSQKKTQVSFSFSFDKDPLVVWLNYQIELGNNREFLVFHPQLQSIDWNAKKQGDYYLYQRKEEYQSIDEFLKNPKGKVYADPEIIKKYPENNFNPINIDTRLGEADYILTTFSPVSSKYDVYFYQKIMDTSDAYRDDADKMFWLFFVPNANEFNTYNLGEIEVVYLQ